ncbi:MULTISPECIES: hypothetical protein [unclassified Oceanispirochaeta]|uniref:hypothetical protein n=1 Tax=unclassified Oceanispirochaeta TaxID=2635722 RepID=UPI000E0929CD|nr:MULTISPECIES: hypothetical protein [unclassified Oceanispirochaeta]MBF9018718.1 hypothetical protein [Oceanispirochaeta sp. M2]NPD75172.1 hypothetical protein [Oceanispirochaeta sp. M1]RDG28993.1 hypothetical protein DV872_24045 [Oceanispirochaeta sp. M1]
MSVIKDVIKEEYSRLNSLIELYDQKISSFPKGSVSVKKRNGHPYLYRAFRDQGRVRFIYLGKPDSPDAKAFIKELERRHKYEEMRKKSLENLKEIKVLLRAVK